MTQHCWHGGVPGFPGFRGCCRLHNGKPCRVVIYHPKGVEVEGKTHGLLPSTEAEIWWSVSQCLWVVRNLRAPLG